MTDRWGGGCGRLLASLAPELGDTVLKSASACACYRARKGLKGGGWKCAER